MTTRMMMVNAPRLYLIFTTKKEKEKQNNAREMKENNKKNYVQKLF